MNRRSSMLTVLAVLLVATSAAMAIPQVFNFQGRLRDTGGSPVTTTTSVLFTIWDAPAGGNALWSETKSVSPDASGTFTEALGSLNPIPDSALAGTAYVGIKVDTDPELTPRIELVSVAHAYRPGTVDGATGGNITSKVNIGPGNSNSGTEAFVAGANNAASGNYSTVGGGHDNSANGHQSTVSGGQNNLASTHYATISGGSGNDALGLYSVISGGADNLITLDYSAISGGLNNSTIGPYSTIAGGEDNDITAGSHGFIAGGYRNEVAGDHAFAAGAYCEAKNNGAVGIGWSCRATGIDAWAIGDRTWASHNGSFVWRSYNPGSVGLLQSTDTNQFLIYASGGVGINNNAPYSELTMKGTIGWTNSSAGPMMYMYESGTNNADRLILSHNPANEDWGITYQDVGDRMIFQGGGLAALSVELSGRNVGIRMEDPTNILQVMQGSSTDPLADAWTTYSSRRWKKNVTTFADAVATVQKLRGVRYEWKETGQRDIGLIAEEVGEVLPEIVAYEENGTDARSLDYARLVAVLIEAVKEQQAQLDAQGARLSQLEASLTGGDHPSEFAGTPTR